MSTRLALWYRLQLLSWVWIQCGVIMATGLTVSTAQITTTITADDTLGTRVIPSERRYEITGGTRPENGSNLFHSFGQFSVEKGDTAHFVGAPGVSRIIGRVTGGAESMIDGRLQSDATLFLLNPNGMMFGPNATLDIDGSFHGSTADVLRFEDGKEFAVRVSGQSSLSVAAPSAFGFVHENPAEITMQRSTLIVPDGEVLSLVGGNMDIAAGNLRAPSGQINLASVASAGDVTLSGVHLDTTSLAAMGSMTITASLLEASGRSSGQVAGQIVIRGGQLTMAHSLVRVTNRSGQDGGGVDVKVDRAIALDGTNVLSDTLDTGQGGHIVLQAASLSLKNDGLIRSGTFGTGRGGAIELAVETLILTEGAEIVSNSRRLDSGPAGSIVIRGRGGDGTAARSVTLRDSTLQTNTDGQGAGGTITVTSESLELARANLTAATTGAGDAGAISLNVNAFTAIDQTLITSDSIMTATGKAGRITMQGLPGTGGASTVMLTDSMLRTSTEGPGAGGAITIMAEAVELSHTNVTATARRSGRAGGIALHVGSLSATRGTTITASSRGAGASGSVTISGLQGEGSMAQAVLLDAASIRNETSSPDQGGDILVQAESLSLSHASEFRSNTFRQGAGGRIILEAESLSLDGQSVIQSDTFGAGRGGAIKLAVGALMLREDAEIVSNSRRLDSGSAGSIVIGGRGGDGTAAHSVTLHDSTLQTNTEGGGAGGTITVIAETVALSRANLTAATTGAGDAGAISLNVNDFTAADQTLITSSSTATATGDAGRVTIQGVSESDAAATVMLSDSTLRTETSSGAGGTITVTSKSVELSHTNLTAATTGVADAGAITLNVEHLEAADQTLITSSSTATATGNAGRVTMQGLGGTNTASRFVAFSNSAVQTQAVSDQANGGAIRVQAQLMHLRDESAIRSDTERGLRGGDIDLDAAFVVLDNSDVIANSEAAQEKADINISGALINNPLSVVQASGDVSIFGSVFDSSSVVQLPLAFLQQAVLLQQRCVHRFRGSQASSFALVGRDGLPLEPGRMLLSDLPIGEHLQVQEGQHPQTPIQDMKAFSPVAWTLDCD